MVITICALGSAACDDSKINTGISIKKSSNMPTEALDPTIKSTKSSSKSKSSETLEWTSEEIMKNPDGYLKKTQYYISSEIRQRQQKSEQLLQKLKSIQEKADRYTNNLSEVENIRKRFVSAIKSAHDEDRWPIKIAGKSFDQMRANKVVNDMTTYIKNNSSIAADYIKLVGSINRSISELKNDIEYLNRMNEKMALDIEKIHLGKGTDNFKDVRSRMSEMSNLSESLTSSDKDSVLESMRNSEVQGSEIVDVSEFIK
jgi:23S rRNA pseudoU1915 N3-methylase RlmH